MIRGLLASTSMLSLVGMVAFSPSNLPTCRMNRPESLCQLAWQETKFGGLGVERDDKPLKLPDWWKAEDPLPFAKTNCVRCHLNAGRELTLPLRDFARSVHDRARMSCNDCHGGNIKDDSREFTVGGSQLLNCSFVRRSLLGEDFLDSGYIVFQHGDPAVQFEAVGGVSRIINP